MTNHLTPNTRQLITNATVCIERGKPSQQAFRLYHLWHWVMALYELSNYTNQLEQRLAEMEERQPYVMPVSHSARR